MKTVRLSVASIALSFIAFVPVVQADSSVESLSPELRALLKKEMIALQTGMQSILPAYISGDLDEVAHIAKKAKNSFILKQKITEDQKQELKTKLPESFIKMDAKFHKYAGMLEHVAEKKNTELVGFYYSKLTESCVSCHTEYAKHRFPKLDINTNQSKHHHH